MEATRCASCGEEIQGPFLIYQGETYCKECIVTCQDCGEQVPEEDAWEYEGEYYCDDCCRECWRCGEHIPESRMTEIDGELLCDECVKECCAECDECGELHINERMSLAADRRRVCTACIESCYTACCRCGMYVHYDEATHDEDGDAHCEDCRDAYLTCCDDCGGYYSCTTRVGECLYCDSCLPHHSKIKMWNYRVPRGDMLFCRHEGESQFNELFFGMEIEMDRGADDVTPSKDIEDLTDILDEPYAIYKGDGSLENGIECVTTPMTFDYLHGEFQPKLQEFCKTATDMGYRSHDTSTCGLHIHISEAALGDFSRCRASDIVKTINCDHNWKFISLFSRRKGDFEYCERIPSCCWVSDTGRYVTVNRNNMTSDRRGTVEFRFFKGTLKWQSILAAVDLCKLIVDLVDEQDDWVAWEQIVETAKERNYEYFLNYLEEQKILKKLGAQELEDEQFLLVQAA